MVCLTNTVVFGALCVGNRAVLVSAADFETLLGELLSDANLRKSIKGILVNPDTGKACPCGVGCDAYSPSVSCHTHSCCFARPPECTQPMLDASLLHMLLRNLSLTHSNKYYN